MTVPKDNREPAPLDPTTDLWERQPDESTPAFEGFTCYRDLGPQRSIRQVAAQLGKPASLTDRWSARWRWTERVRAWDARQDSVRRDEAAQALAAMHARHARLAEAMTEKIAQRLERINVDDLSPSQMAHWLDVAVKVERVARGDVSDRAGLEHTGHGGGPIAIDDLSGYTAEEKRARLREIAAELTQRAGDDPGVVAGDD